MLTYSSALFFGLPGCYSLSSGVEVSSRWFKPTGRTMTTGIVSFTNSIGPMVAALIGSKLFDIKSDLIKDLNENQDSETYN